MKLLFMLKNRGHDVKIVVFKNLPVHNNFNILKAKGIEVFFIEEQEAVLPALFKRAILKLLSKPVTITYKNRHDFIHSLNPDLILLSQGSATDITYYSDLKLYFEQIKIPFFLLSLHHNEFGSLPKNQREYLSDLFSRAKKNCFVSQRNLEVIERQLAFKIPSAVIVKSPVSLINKTIVDWPISQIPLIAVVARLDINFKGQDILLQALSLPKWQQRSFVIKFLEMGPIK